MYVERGIEQCTPVKGTKEYNRAIGKDYPRSTYGSEIQG